MNAEIQDIKARIAAHKATRPDVLKALHPDAPKALRSAYREWSKSHELLQNELARAEWRERSHWRGQGGEIIQPLGWQSTGELLSPKEGLEPNAEISANGRRLMGILEQLARLHEVLRELQEHDKESPEWRAIRDQAVRIRMGVVRGITQEELLLEIPDVPLPPKKKRV